MFNLEGGMEFDVGGGWRCFEHSNRTIEPSFNGALNKRVRDLDRCRVYHNLKYTWFVFFGPFYQQQAEQSLVIVEIALVFTKMYIESLKIMTFV